MTDTRSELERMQQDRWQVQHEGTTLPEMTSFHNIPVRVLPWPKDCPIKREECYPGRMADTGRGDPVTLLGYPPVFAKRRWYVAVRYSEGAPGWRSWADLTFPDAKPAKPETYTPEQIARVVRMVIAKLREELESND